MAALIVIGIKYVCTDKSLLKITQTSFPACQTRTCVISREHLTLIEEDQSVTTVKLNSKLTNPLVNAITNPSISNLALSYEDSSVRDGFLMVFEFHAGSRKKVEVANRYVPELFAILEECGKLLPEGRRFEAKQPFVWHNSAIDLEIRKVEKNSSMTEEMREQAINNLRNKIVPL